jgi:hypothetical protein
MTQPSASDVVEDWYAAVTPQEHVSAQDHRGGETSV